MGATPDIYSPLPRSFYMRGTVTVARELLGMFLVRKIDGEVLVGRIVETEAYVGEDDLACHAARGRTARTEVMFGEAGRAYVYLIYGMYHCLNIVTETKDFPAAVLIRAVEPVTGIENMQERRDGKSLTEIASGPGKLCAAMAIDRRLDGVDVCVADQLWVSVGERIGDEQVEQSPRIGVDYAGACAAWPWRFTIKGSEYLSR